MFGVQLRHSFSIFCATNAFPIPSHTSIKAGKNTLLGVTLCWLGLDLLLSLTVFGFALAFLCMGQSPQEKDQWQSPTPPFCRKHNQLIQNVSENLA